MAQGMKVRFGADLDTTVNSASGLSLGLSREAQRNEDTFQDWGKAIGDVVQGGAKLYTQVKAAEANDARVEWNSFIQGDYQTLPEEEKQAALEAKLIEAQNTSDTFFNSWTNLAGNEYIRNKNQVQTNSDNSKVSAHGVGYEDWLDSASIDSNRGTYTEEGELFYADTKEKVGEGALTNRESGKGPADYADFGVSTTNGRVKPSAFAYSHMAQEYTTYNTNVATATNSKALDEAIADIEVEKKKFSKGDNRFLDSQGKEMKAKVKELQTNLNNTIKQKIAFFKGQAQERIAVTKTGYESDTILGTNPMFSEEDILVSYDNALSQKSARDTMNNDYKEQLIRVDYLSSNTPGESVKANVPKEAKEGWQRKVTEYATRHVAANNYDGFISTVNYSPDESKEVGNVIYQEYTQLKSTKDLKPLMEFLVVTSKKAGGATAISQSLGDDNYAEVFTAAYIADQMFDGDLMKARAHVQSIKQDITKTSIPLNEKDDIFEYANSMGPGKDRYLTQMKLMYQISPSLAKQEYKNVAQYYKDQTNKTDAGDLSIVEDMSMNDFKTTSQSLDFDRVRTGIAKKFKDITGFEAGTFTYLPKGQVMVTDKVTGFTTVVNGQAIADKVNETIFEEKRVEKERLKKAKAQREDTGGTIADTVEQLSINAPGLETPIRIVQGLSKVATKFGGYLKSQMDKDVDTVVKLMGLIPQTEKDKVHKEILKDELATEEYINALDNFITNTPTILNEPANNTMTYTKKQDIKYAILNNKAEVDKAKNIKKSLVGPEDLDARIRQVESDNISTAHRTGSNFYGLYQIGKEEAASTFEETGLNENTWKTPGGQEKTYQVLKKQYLKELHNKELPVTALNVYIRHQQGLKGMHEILRGGKMSSARVRSMRSNLPGQENYKDSEVRDAYLEYWRLKI